MPYLTTAHRSPTPCKPLPKLPCFGNCTYTIAELTPGEPPSACCGNFLPDIQPGLFVPVADEISIVATGSGYAKITTERHNRKEFGVQNTSTFTLSVPANPQVYQGQWALIDRLGLLDHGEIVAIDRKGFDWMQLTIDTAKVLPFDRSLIFSGG
jgi:hypothetical protein